MSIGARCVMRNVIRSHIPRPRTTIPAASSPSATARVIILAVALGLLAAGIVVRGRGMWDLITLRMTHRAPIDMVLVGFVLFGLPYGFSAFTTYTREPRYLFTLYPLLALALA